MCSFWLINDILAMFQSHWYYLVSDEQIPSIDTLNQSRESIEERLAYFSGITPEEDPVLPELSPEDHSFKFAGSIPEIPAAELTAQTLSGAMSKHGLLLIRGLVDSQQCKRFRHMIDSTLDAPRSTLKKPLPESEVRSFYNNPPRNLPQLLPDLDINQLRAFLKISHACMCVESAGLALNLMEFYEALGLKGLIADYLGEELCLSAQKWVLRRVPEDVREDGWHQDGSFMGKGIKSLNMWLPLSYCGGSSGAPGMDIVPALIREIYCSPDGLYDWSLSTSNVTEWFAESPPESPTLEPGDALFFDHYSVHRTQYRKEFSRPRYAIETWFFGSRSFPKNQIPLQW